MLISRARLTEMPINLPETGTENLCVNKLTSGSGAAGL